MLLDIDISSRSIDEVIQGLKFLIRQHEEDGGFEGGIENAEGKLIGMIRVHSGETSYVRKNDPMECPKCGSLNLRLHSTAQPPYGQCADCSASIHVVPEDVNVDF